MKISDQFEQSKPAVIDSDATAQRVMMELDVWDEVSQQGSLSGNVNMMLVEGHPTHWCLCGRIWNNPDANENGFVVVTFPKKMFLKSFVLARMAETISGCSAVVVRPVGINPLE